MSRLGYRSIRPSVDHPGLILPTSAPNAVVPPRVLGRSAPGAGSFRPNTLYIVAAPRWGQPGGTFPGCKVLIGMQLVRKNGVIVEQGHREFSFGNSRAFPGIRHFKNSRRNSREFLNFWRKILTVHKIPSLVISCCELWKWARRHENLFSPFYEFKSLKLLDSSYYS